MAKPRKKCLTSDPLIRRVFELIDASKFTDKDISVRAGVGQGYISELRRTGKTAPSAYLLDCILRVLGHRLEIVKDGDENGTETGSDTRKTGH